jgi:hypothetical protein
MQKRIYRQGAKAAKEKEQVSRWLHSERKAITERAGAPDGPAFLAPWRFIVSN